MVHRAKYEFGRADGDPRTPRSLSKVITPLKGQEFVLSRSSLWKENGRGESTSSLESPGMNSTGRGSRYRSCLLTTSFTLNSCQPSGPVSKSRCSLALYLMKPFLPILADSWQTQVWGMFKHK